MAVEAITDDQLFLSVDEGQLVRKDQIVYAEWFASHQLYALYDADGNDLGSISPKRWTRDSKHYELATTRLQPVWSADKAGHILRVAWGADEATAHAWLRPLTQRPNPQKQKDAT